MCNILQSLVGSLNEVENIPHPVAQIELKLLVGTLC